MPRRLLTLVFAAMVVAQVSRAADPAPAPAQAVDVSKIKGAEAIKTKEEVTGLNFPDATTLTEDDYKLIRQMEHLKSLQFNHGPSVEGMKILTGMPEVEKFTTNGIAITDDHIKVLATFPNLQVITFFHPGKDFTGASLGELSKLEHLTGFTSGGTNAFSDAGMAALGTLPHLQDLRVWHAGVKIDGVKSIGKMKLKSLTLGQQLAMKPPGTLTDEAVGIVAGITTLEALILQESRLSLPALQKLKALPNLKRLSLKGIEISESDVATLKAEMPKVPIDWSAPEGVDKQRIDKIFGAPAGTAPEVPATPPAPKK